jgi:hypothetical protein
MKTLFHVLGIALLLVAAQAGFGLIFAPSSSDPKLYYPTNTPVGWQGSVSRYMRLNNWDSFHYYEVVERGYHVLPGELIEDDLQNFRSNGGVFPGFPTAVRLIRTLLGVSSEVSLILTAQISALIFWAYFLLLFQLWGVPKKNGSGFSSG